MILDKDAFVGIHDWTVLGELELPAKSWGMIL